MPSVAFLRQEQLMSRLRFVTALVLVSLASPMPVTRAQQPQAPAQPEPPAGAPAQAAPAQPAAPGQPPAPAAVQTRTFSAPAGLLFNTVRPERVADFEKVLAYLQAAFAKSSDPNVRAQGEGWRIFKATEAGPGGTVLYVYAIDPAVMGADYGLGKILADAYPDQVTEIWKLYTSALSGGGSLLNLTPVKPVPPPPLPSATQKR
jgi:hypothetical protein